MEIDLSAILDPFGSNQFTSCPQVLLFSCALVPLPPVSDKFSLKLCFSILCLSGQKQLSQYFTMLNRITGKLVRK